MTPMADTPIIVGRDVDARVGMQVRLAPGVDDFVPWVPSGMVGRIIRLQVGISPLPKSDTAMLALRTATHVSLVFRG